MTEHAPERDEKLDGLLARLRTAQKDVDVVGDMAQERLDKARAAIHAYFAEREREKEGLRSCADYAVQQLREAEAEIGRLREVLRWVVNVAYGKGKAGGRAEPGEYRAAFEAGEAALASPPPAAEEKP